MNGGAGFYAPLDSERAMDWEGAASEILEEAARCPSRLGDGARWLDTHGGAVATCVACDAHATIASWVQPLPAVGDTWLVGAHQVFDPVALRDALAGVS